MPIPEKYKRGLIKAHKLGSSIIQEAHRNPEPLETALVAQAHRWFWKPKDVKFIVVAESHVHTSEKENKVKMELDRLPKGFPQNAPLRFVKLVYCLGYGEPDILDAPEMIDNNKGTPPYWKLFGEWIGFYPNRRGIEWKLEVLNRMKEKGIWLLDASCHACAMGKDRSPRLPPSVVEEIVRISWEMYVKPIIDDVSIDPKSVWIIGKGLHDSLRELPDSLSGNYARGSNWIYQPNAHWPENPEKYEEKRAKEAELNNEIRSRCEIG
jgi:hypothetical protein